MYNIQLTLQPLLCCHVIQTMHSDWLDAEQLFLSKRKWTHHADDDVKWPDSVLELIPLFLFHILTVFIQNCLMKSVIPVIVDGMIS